MNLDELRKLESDEQLRYFLAEREKMKQQVLPNFDLTEMRRSLDIFKVNSQAMWDYQPQVYPGKIIFFRALEKDAINAKHPERAWIDLVQKGLEIIDVRGNHITMNESPHVQVIAERLRAYLENS